MTKTDDFNAILAILGLQPQMPGDVPTQRFKDLCEAVLREKDTPEPPKSLLPSKLPWTAYVDGDDLVVRNITTTCFGGAYDAGDNGETESGVMNDGSNDLLQCALPIRSTEAATRNSPLAFKGPHIPWKTEVRVWREADGEETAITCILTDNGPDVSRFPTHALDLNPPMALQFNHDPAITLRNVSNKWSSPGMSYRIVGGSKWVS